MTTEVKTTIEEYLEIGHCDIDALPTMTGDTAFEQPFIRCANAPTPLIALRRPSVLLDGVQKIRVVTEAGKVKVQFEMDATRRFELGRLARIAHSGTARVQIEGLQGEMWDE